MDEPTPMTDAEQKELRRVFNQLTNYEVRRELTMERKPKDDRRQKLSTFLRAAQTMVTAAKIVDKRGNPMTDEEIASEFEMLNSECTRLTRRITELDTLPDKKITSADLNGALKDLGKEEGRGRKGASGSGVCVCVCTSAVTALEKGVYGMERVV